MQTHKIEILKSYYTRPAQDKTGIQILKYSAFSKPGRTVHKKQKTN